MARPNAWRMAHQTATLPIRPIGLGAEGAADAMQAATPVVSMLGDQALNSVAPMVADVGAKALGQGASMVGGGLTDLAGSLAASGGPFSAWAAPAIEAVGHGISEAAPMAAEIGSKVAMPVAKAAGRATYGAGTQMLKGLSKAAGVYPSHPEADKANMFRAIASSAPLDMKGPTPDIKKSANDIGEVPSIESAPTEMSSPSDSRTAAEKDMAARYSHDDPQQKAILNAMQKRPRFGSPSPY